MSHPYGPEERPLSDLTARARIRDAALVEFAEHGVKGATTRGIAQAAGVSPGLLRHHFGSKEGLRRACDEALLDLFRRRLIQASLDGEINPNLLDAVYTQGTPMLRYLARCLVDGTPGATAVMEELVGGNERFLTSTWPDRFPPGSEVAHDTAVVMSAMNGGTVILHEQVARLMGLRPWVDLRSPRIGMAMVAVYTSLAELIGSQAGDQLTEAIESLDQSPQPPEETT